jgi:hypothetical protein
LENDLLLEDGLEVFRCARRYRAGSPA